MGCERSSGKPTSTSSSSSSSSTSSDASLGRGPKPRFKMVEKKSTYISPKEQHNTPKFPTETEVVLRMVTIFRTDFKRQVAWTLNRKSDVWKARYRIAYTEILAEKQKLYKLK